MNKILKKLKNSSGASMVFALIAILVAVVVSILILTAATTSARSVKADKKQTQSSLTVNSAAELIMDELSNIKAKVNIKEIKDGGTITGIVYTTSEADITVNGRESFLASEICAAFSAISYTDYTPVQEYVATFDIESKTMDTVKGTFLMKNGNHSQEEAVENYEIIISLTDGKTNVYITAFVSSVTSATGDVTIQWNPQVSSAGN